MNPFYISQLLAFAAFLSGMAAFQVKQRHHILTGWFISASLNAAHFFVIGAHEAGVLVSITAIRFLLSSRTDSKYLMAIFLCLTGLGFIAAYESAVSLIALGASFTGTVGSFQKDTRFVRGSMIIASSLWATHNGLIGSPIAMIMEIAFIVSNLVGFYRFRKT